ncbi:hypothetical protein QA644_14485 [Rhizobium sp. CC1099]|uniref:hypothetical protein n=1 Tax=Rhizobium sp. CC1099 TaxID=3039160 RepID=UPI0024B192C9|nr:hypothetical protein [Rhizobium sp. CC1099]WFU86336.1 hypothetical protein QA644_14485 [Rhizobium sp. CC1099]
MESFRPFPPGFFFGTKTASLLSLWQFIARRLVAFAVFGLLANAALAQQKTALDWTRKDALGFVPDGRIQMGMTKFEIESLIAKNFNRWTKTELRIPLDPADTGEAKDPATSFDRRIRLEYKVQVGRRDDTERYYFYFTSPLSDGQLYSVSRDVRFDGYLRPSYAVWAHSLLALWEDPPAFIYDAPDGVKKIKYFADQQGALDATGTESCQKSKLTDLKKRSVRELSNFVSDVLSGNCLYEITAEATMLDDGSLSLSEVSLFQADLFVIDLMKRKAAFEH